MDKRGVISFPMGWFIFIAGFVVFFLGALSLAIHIGVTNIYDTEDVANFVYVSNIVNAKNGIMKYDSDIDRVYPNIVSHFETSILDNSMYYDDPSSEIPSARLVLTDLGTNSTREIFWHKESYDRLVIKSAFKGSGAPASYKTVRLVKEEKNGKLIPSKLEIFLLIPKNIEYTKGDASV